VAGKRKTTTLALVPLSAEPPEGAALLLEDREYEGYRTMYAEAVAVCQSFNLEAPIKDRAAASVATDALVAIARICADLEARRLAKTTPLRRMIDTWQTLFARPQDVLREVEAVLKKKIAAYITAEEEAKAQAEAAARKKEEEAQIRQAEAMAKLNEALDAQDAAMAEETAEGQPAAPPAEVLEAVATAQAAVQEASLDVMEHRIAGNMQVPVRGFKTDDGTVSAVPVWTYDVVKIEDVPREFLAVEVDHRSVMAAIGRGVRDIPGLAIFEGEAGADDAPPRGPVPGVEQREKEDVMPFGIGGPELLVIFAIVALFWGGQKAAALGKGLGEGIRNFRKGLRGDDD
jgi:sec-independent protein translocase protein TatA